MAKRPSRNKSETAPGAPAPAQQGASPPPAAPGESAKDPAAVRLGRKGGLRGGPARARKLTQQQRSEIARKAALARWANRQQ